MRNLPAIIGYATLRRLERLNRIVSVLCAVLVAAVQPANWRGPTREVFSRQIYFSGVTALRFVSTLALLLGISAVNQVQIQLNNLGSSSLIGPLLKAITIRDLGPLLINIIVVGRSGTAITSELAGMQVNDEVRVLEAQGVDPLHYLVMPRVLAMAICVFCLTVFFAVIALISGCLSGPLLGVAANSPAIFMDIVLQALEPVDFVHLVVKTLVPGLFSGVICCLYGLDVERSLAEIPQATTQSLGSSMMAMFLVFAVMTIVIYSLHI